MLDKYLLADLLDEINRPIARYAYLESYYYGRQHNGYLTKEQRDLLGRASVSSVGGHSEAGDYLAGRASAGDRL